MVVHITWSGGLCQVVCEEYNWLNNEAWHIARNVWNVKPKFHMFKDMAPYQSLEMGNPRVFWEYKDEKRLCGVG